MSSTVIKSVSFPKNILQELDDIAKQRRCPRSRVLAEAVRRYYRAWLLEKEQAVGRRYAKKLGIKTEKDVSKLLGE